VLFRDSGPYGIIFMNVCCYILTVVMVMLLRHFGPYRIIVMTVFTALDFPLILDGLFISQTHNIVV
jgi:hypothetical protein